MPVRNAGEPFWQIFTLRNLKEQEKADAKLRIAECGKLIDQQEKAKAALLKNMPSAEEQERLDKEKAAQALL